MRRITQLQCEQVWLIHRSRLPKLIPAVKASKSCKNPETNCDEKGEGCSMNGRQKQTKNNIENMKILIKFALAVAILTTTFAAQAGWVSGYYRSSGTFVAP
jgi:hypothetical protein